MENQEPVLFYEREFYVFSNFSSFAIEWKGKLWMISEHAYQAERFEDEAIKFTGANKDKGRKDWQEVKIGIMKEILREKLRQHPYVEKKLLQSGDRELVEDSWRDDFWGWGPNKDGKNQLGKLWMEVREEFKTQL